MPSLSLFAATSPMIAAALAGTSAPQAAETPAPVSEVVAPQDWTLAPLQAPGPQDDAPVDTDAAPLAESDSTDGEEVTEIIIEGQIGPPKSDPIERVNEQSYRAVQAVDAAVIEPVADAYRDGLPEPVRDGLGNVVRNLGEPAVALNFLLQGKVGKAFETLGRMAINTTVGIGGLFDVAGKRAGLPYRRNGFANTLGFYGVGAGPYLYLPVTGATTVRDLAGSTLDQALLPFLFGKPFNKPAYAATYFVVNGLDQRLKFDEDLAKIAASDDPYRMRRETYLAQRRRAIAELKGEPISERDQMWLDELEGTGDFAPEPEPAIPAGTPVEAPANPEMLSITQPR